MHRFPKKNVFYCIYTIGLKKNRFVYKGPASKPIVKFETCIKKSKQVSIFMIDQEKSKQVFIFSNRF